MGNGRWGSALVSPLPLAPCPSPIAHCPSGRLRSAAGRAHHRQSQRLEPLQQLEAYHLQPIRRFRRPLIDAPKPLILLCQPPVHALEAVDHFPTKLFESQHARQPCERRAARRIQESCEFACRLRRGVRAVQDLRSTRHQQRAALAARHVMSGGGNQERGSLEPRHRQ